MVESLLAILTNNDSDDETHCSTKLGYFVEMVSLIHCPDGCSLVLPHHGRLQRRLDYVRPENDSFDHNDDVHKFLTSFLDGGTFFVFPLQ